MIGQLSGKLVSKNPPQVILDVQGVGYEIDVPMSSFYDLPEIGKGITLLTHFVVREDAQLLYGFLTHDERRAFRELIKVSGVGPRIGLAVLSGLSVSQLVQAISMQEVGLLTRVPGIGKKTAERLILELKGKLGESMASPGSLPVGSQQADIVHALLALGYSEKEALMACKGLAQGASVSDGIKQALRQLAK
jgi:Holliday junction DNA helicase RuvA